MCPLTVDEHQDHCSGHTVGLCSRSSHLTLETITVCVYSCVCACARGDEISGVGRRVGDQIRVSLSRELALYCSDGTKRQQHVHMLYTHTHRATYGDDNTLTLCVLWLFQANIGQMDTTKDMWKMIMGNLALIQVKERPQYKRVQCHRASLTTLTCA